MDSDLTLISHQMERVFRITAAAVDIAARHPELLFLLCGCTTAFIMAVFRSFQFTRRHLCLRFTEAVMCSMLTASVAVGFNEFWGLRYIWAIPAGTIIGFLGTDLLHSLLSGLVRYHAVRHTGGEESHFASHEGGISPGGGTAPAPDSRAVSRKE